MSGLDEVELQLDTSMPASASTAAANAGMRMQTSGVLAAIIPVSEPANDYDPQWPLKAHPSAFPNGTGACPKGVSFTHWMRSTMQRYPREQFAHNAGLTVDLFNIEQRHTVNTQAAVQLRLSPRMARDIARLTEGEVQQALDVVGKGFTGPRLVNAMRRLPPAGRTLLTAMKRTGAHVIGSPQAFLSLRSKVTSPWVVFGPYTVMMNLCPSETCMAWTFELAGKAYTFDVLGRPQGRPSVTESLRVVATNFFACAHAIHAYMAAFAAVFLGWPMGATSQVNQACLFGVVLAYFLKYEGSGRGGKHGHGQAIQPVLQSQNLRRLFEGGDGTVRDQIYAFTEGLMCSYVPTPDRREQRLGLASMVTHPGFSQVRLPRRLRG
jgi:hypothetical protein